MHLQTISGHAFSPLAPTVADIRLEDIAHALAHLCRFGGHVRTFYSVAQHAVLVSHVVPPDLALWGLLHDASEAYLVDLPTPVKATAALAGYRGVEALLQRTVYQAFGLVGEEPDALHVADEQLLLLEAGALLHPAAAARLLAAAPADLALPPIAINPVDPARAKAGFLRRFYTLRGGRP
ncbi:MAG: phosphohydrolase [Vicinamibacterales bacterium]